MRMKQLIREWCVQSSNMEARSGTPYTQGLQDELEKVQYRAARFVTRDYTREANSVTGILEQLKWESLKKRRRDNRLILLYEVLKGKARIPTRAVRKALRHIHFILNTL